MAVSQVMVVRTIYSTVITRCKRSREPNMGKEWIACGAAGGTPGIETPSGAFHSTSIGDNGPDALPGN